jgi:hypothetical protein
MSVRSMLRALHVSSCGPRSNPRFLPMSNDRRKSATSNVGVLFGQDVGDQVERGRRRSFRRSGPR